MHASIYISYRRMLVSMLEPLSLPILPAAAVTYPPPGYRTVSRYVDITASFLHIEIFIHCLNTCKHTHSHAALHPVAYLPDLSYPLRTCMHACAPPHTYAHAARTCMHHDIAHITPSYIHTYLYIPADSVSYTVVASHTHTYGHTSFSAAPASYYVLLRNKPRTHSSCMHSTSVLSCLDERTACIRIYLFLRRLRLLIGRRC